MALLFFNSSNEMHCHIPYMLKFFSIIINENFDSIVGEDNEKIKNHCSHYTQPISKLE